MASQTIVHLTDTSFDPTLAAHAEPVVVDFWAEWCGPCKAIAPVLEELAQEYAGRVTVAKVNVDEYPGLAARFQVRSIPMLLFFKAGQVVDQVVGAVPKAQIKKRLDAVA
jgi:thioredoxin 1